MKKGWMILIVLGVFLGMGLDLALAQQSQKGTGIDSFIEALKRTSRRQDRTIGYTHTPLPARR